MPLQKCSASSFSLPYALVELRASHLVWGEGQFNEEDKTTFSPLEAMAAILVQHAEVIATSYTAEGVVVVTDSPL